LGKYQLIPHPDFPPIAVQDLEVELDLSQSGVLTLWYTVFGPPDALTVPSEVPERRADDLWKSTCFELFVREPPSNSYLEFNFSPSTEWAAYRFDEYRNGRRDAHLPHSPIISSSRIGWLEVHVTLPLDLIRGGQALQLSAIIEEKDGTKSYWALAHPPGDPDFHHPDCFVLQLPPAV
jgi:hypothetical protein